MLLPHSQLWKKSFMCVCVVNVVLHGGNEVPWQAVKM